MGNCGEYESKIICAIDPEIGACINANNGYPFNHIPFALRMKEAIRASVSTKFWEKLNKLKERESGHDNYMYFVSVLDQSEYLREAFQEMKKRYPDIIFETVIKGYAMDAIVEYLSLTMRKLTNEQ